MIIDGETVITGSFNFTKAAEENNAENLLIIHDKMFDTSLLVLHNHNALGRVLSDNREL
jgi:phosphatidylserine/phosphatidylglycerophosphate/cardiolipin synthase-like enzyme